MISNSMQNWLNRQFTLVADFLLPPSCFICGEAIEAQGDMCPKCWSELNFVSSPSCDRCGFPFEFTSSEVFGGGVNDGSEALCGACVMDAPAYDVARSALRYDDPSRRLVLNFKHGDEHAGVGAFGRMMWRSLGRHGEGMDVIVPVPLHPKRLFQRRFNQSALLAQAVGRASGLKVNLRSLLRVRPTPSQGQMGRGARIRNVRGAFALAPRAREAFRGKGVVLVDDVMTTGATVQECARVLRRAGAGKIAVITLARVARNG